MPAAPASRAALAGVIPMAVPPTPSMAAPTSSGILGRTARTLTLALTKTQEIVNRELNDGESDLGDIHSPAQGQSTTLTVTVTAIPGGGGAPSGTVNFMLGSTLLETATLLPTGANSTAATLPLSASQLAAGANTLTAVYSGNSIAPCCPISGPPVTVYGSSTSPPIVVTLQ